MPTDVSIPAGDLATALRTIGRARAVYSPYWDGTADLALSLLGDMEGEPKLDPKSSIDTLKVPELTGDAPWEAWETGAAPEASLPLFLADPAQRPILTPTGGTGGAGRIGRKPVKAWTVVLLPEEIFRNAAGEFGTAVTFAKVGATWKLDGVAFTAEQTRLLKLSVWMWRGFFSRPPITYKMGDGGKAIDTVTFTLLQDRSKPQGQQLYTRGDPADVGIDIDPV
ncbi:MAG TPA: hypothetical protein VFJ16_24835 [Longimicrobium sp.]|nr:hypothetical protein [Longimicrobium sp.]